MILDRLCELANAQTVNLGAPGLYAFGDTIDTGTAPNPLDAAMLLVLVVATTFTSGGAASLRFHVASDAQGAIATDGTATVHYATAEVALASLVAGYRIAALHLPSGPYERFLGLLQQTIGAAFTAGKVDAFLVSDPALYRTHADNVA